MPTRNSGTLIDHLYTHNVCQADVTTEVTDCYYSDHDIVACAIDGNNNKANLYSTLGKQLVLSTGLCIWILD